MEPVTLLAQARAAGLELWAEGDHLKVRGPRAAEGLVSQLREHKPAILALLRDQDAEVSWRLAIFRARIPAHGPIYPPKLRNTPLTDTPGCCGLCGESLSPERRYRCGACVTALEIALSELREGVTVTPPAIPPAQRREEGAA